MSGLRSVDDLRDLLRRVTEARGQIEALVLDRSFNAEWSRHLDRLVRAEEPLAAWIQERESWEEAA